MQKYNKTGAQIALNWGIQRNCAVIPKSNSFDRLKENIESLSFQLTTQEVEMIDKIDEGIRICDQKWLGNGTSMFA